MQPRQSAKLMCNIENYIVKKSCNDDNGIVVYLNNVPSAAALASLSVAIV